MDTNSDNMETKIRYLEMIQNVISRMASNSFLLKGWTVTIIVGLFVFANKADNMDAKYILLAFIPTIFFWILDGFFIHQEKLFRELYKHATGLNPVDVDFSMDTTPFNDIVGSWSKATWSKTLKLFYIPIIVLVIVGFVFGLLN